MCAYYALPYFLAVAIFNHLAKVYVVENPTKKVPSGDLNGFAKDILGHRCAVLRSNALRNLDKNPKPVDADAVEHENNEEEPPLHSQPSRPKPAVYRHRWGFRNHVDFIEFVDDRKNAVDAFICAVPKIAPKEAAVWSEMLRIPRYRVGLLGVSF